MDGNKKIITSIQFSRALAIILVIISHSIDAAGSLGHSYIASFKHFENFGAIGVDIFFVVSGAIMIIITSNNKITPGNFFLRRFIRIVPLYWGISAFALLLTLFGIRPADDPAKILQTITIIPITLAGYKAGHILFFGWTLSFEFYFYLIMMLALFVRKEKPFIILSLLLLIQVLLRLLIKGMVSDERLNFFANPIILEFLAGSFAGYLYLTKTKSHKCFAYFFVAGGVLLMLWTVFNGFENIIRMNHTWDGTLSLQRFYIWGIPSFLLVNGLLLLEKNKIFSVNKFWIITGDISYSAYLSHVFSIKIISLIWRHFEIRLPDLFLFFALFFSLFIAYFINRFIEKPLISYLNKKVSGKSIGHA